jgi:hypothetical protein
MKLAPRTVVSQRDDPSAASPARPGELRALRVAVPHSLVIAARRRHCISPTIAGPIARPTSEADLV